ncbi:uncharacterized protein LOC126815154 [Patella vulgata]|uniref:uncharacterized protein LOC126815154 n=1 Tax=Patella vulgata TaxID=6465 RepID=UPI00217F8027|nr:uncharacterized protein LOC126815154 [Patella vulgata]
MADICGDIPTIADIKSHVISFASNIKDERTSVDVREYTNSLHPKFDILEEKKKAEGWLDWAKQLKTLKIIRSSVPIAILPNGYRGVLIDVKVNSPHAPDDKIYDTNEKIRQRVARGNCFLQIENGPHNGTTCVLYGLKKFTGGLGDDDDRDQGDNFTWKKYFTKPLESTERVVATRKANGEAAHLSCQIIDGHFVMCGGSKNVHLLFRRKEDIDRYKEPRYLIAREVCETVMHHLELMDQNDRFLLLSFLSHTHFTAVFEILSPVHQHVEDLSHLSRNELRFITWTEINIDSRNDGELCTVPPHVAIEIARALKLPTVDYDVIPMADLENQMMEVYKYNRSTL